MQQPHRHTHNTPPPIGCNEYAKPCVPSLLPVFLFREGVARAVGLSRVQLGRDGRDACRDAAGVMLGREFVRFMLLSLSRCWRDHGTSVLSLLIINAIDNERMDSAQWLEVNGRGLGEKRLSSFNVGRTIAARGVAHEPLKHVVHLDQPSRGRSIVSSSCLIFRRIHSISLHSQIASALDLKKPALEHPRC